MITFGKSQAFNEIDKTIRNECNHQNPTNQEEQFLCRECGTFIYHTKTQVYGAKQFASQIYTDPIRFVQNCVKECMLNYKFEVNTYYIQVRHNFIKVKTKNHRVQSPSGDQDENEHEDLVLIDMLLRLGDVECPHSRKPYFFVRINQCISCRYLLRTISAKSMEKDDNIPLISSMQQIQFMLDPSQSFQTKQYKDAEMQIIRATGWNLHITTIFDRVETLLTMGIIDEDDSLMIKEEQEVHDDCMSNSIEKKAFNTSKLKEQDGSVVDRILTSFTENYQSICLRLVQDNMYLINDHALLAFAIVGYLRKSGGIMNVWSFHLQTITSCTTQQITTLVSQLLVKFPKQKQSLPKLEKVSASEKVLLSKPTQNPLDNKNSKRSSAASELNAMNVLLSDSIFVKQQPRCQVWPKKNVGFLNENTGFPIFKTNQYKSSFGSTVDVNQWKRKYF